MKKISRRRKIVFIVLGSILVSLIALHIAMPYILLRLVNKELSHIPGYTEFVDDIDVALIRGAYKIKTMKLEKTCGKVPFHHLPLPQLGYAERPKTKTTGFF